VRALRCISCRSGLRIVAVLSGAEPLPVQSTRGPGCRSETSAQPGSPPCRTLSPLPYPQPAFSVGVWACRGIIFAEFLAQLWEPGTTLSRATETLSLPTTTGAQGPGERCTGLGNAAREFAQRCCQIRIGWLRSAGWPIPERGRAIPEIWLKSRLGSQVLRPECGFRLSP
jgi:hypothetical protein